MKYVKYIKERQCGIKEKINNNNNNSNNHNHNFFHFSWTSQKQIVMNIHVQESLDLQHPKKMSLEYSNIPIKVTFTEQTPKKKSILMYNTTLWP